MNDEADGRKAPWPFGAEKIRRELNLDLIEAHAVDIVGRAMATRRLVVFAGAGLTMSYGRMTWSQLLEQMYLKLFKDLDELRRAAAKRLWPKDIDDFRDNKRDYVIAAQLFQDMWPESPPMHEWVAGQLHDHSGRLEQLMLAFGFGEEQQSEAQKLEHVPAEKAALAKKRPSLDAFIRALAEQQFENRSELESKYMDTFLPLRSREESPLDILINEFGIRRFLTTNYDATLERGLEVFDYPARDARTQQVIASHGTWHRSRNLTKKTTGEAICFAVDGARRHAEVLHLHGSCDKAPELIISEGDYQRLYLEDHDTRDLLENAVRANFGANPILFVGSNVEEDDIMRPMRQFMTGARHRRDRMAVALLPALSGDVPAYHQKLTLYLRFGVHAIHYGYAHDSSKKRINVLEQVSTICSKFQGLCERLKEENSGTSHSDDAYRADKDYLTVFDSRDRRSALRISLDSNRPMIQRHTGEDDARNDKENWETWNLLDYSLRDFAPMSPFPKKYIELVNCLHFVLVRLGGCIRKPTETRTTTVALEELRSAFTTLFMCAELTQLRVRADQRYRTEHRLPWHWERPLDPQSEDYVPIARHAVELFREGYEGWFARPDPSGRFRLREPRKRLVGLVEQIRKNDEFRELDGRRAIIISGPRGAGKGGLFDSLRERYRLRAFCKALRPPAASAESPLIFHLNLSFSDDIGAALSHVARKILRTLAKDIADLQHDQLEMLSLAMEALKLPGKRRCLLMLGNATVLFDERGEPKNGQVRRLMQLLMSETFEKSRLDVVLFCSEAYVPAVFRVARRSKASSISSAKDTLPPVLPGSAKYAKFASRIRMMERRQQLLNLRPLHRHLQPGTLLLGLRPLHAEDLYQDFFGIKGDKIDAPFNGEKTLADELHELDLATGENRMAMTMILALLRIGAESSEKLDSSEGLHGIVRELSARPPGAAMEKVTALVFDRWFQLHLREAAIRWHGPAEDLASCTPRDSDGKIKLSLQHWNVVTEVMWTLSVISQPVDARVLFRSDSVRDALIAWLKSCAPQSTGQPTVPDHGELMRALEGTLELLVHWCLVFRVKYRPGAAAKLYRYSLHRQIQRHFLQLSGGHRIETTRWDQFATTLYASQPDELPTISRATHEKLVKLVEALSQPCNGESGAAEREEARESLRAAYALIRSSFSMGVLARSAQIPAKGDNCGAMEQYRRLVHWILRRARELDGHTQGEGVFYPGELLWLYNEGGVISLAQGKLDEAEELLTLAERAVKYVENDSTGSLHVRVLLHTALTAIERGRLSQGRAMLLPISKRRGGHPVPRELAKFYLGLIEHLGGNYTAAQSLYSQASAGLREVGRPRALAFVLQAQADLRHVLPPKEMDQALSMTDEAISLAQKGGHEDLRVIASLAKVRLQIEAGATRGVFEQLDFAERYATRMDMPRIACEVHELRARLLHQQGETVMSAREASASLEIAALYDLKLMKIRAMLTLAKIYVARGEHEGATALVESGKEMARSADYFSCVRQFDELELKLAERSTA